MLRELLTQLATVLLGALTMLLARLIQKYLPDTPPAAKETTRYDEPHAQPMEPAHQFRPDS